ncbi:MAG: hypothetical protein JW719_04305 [Pirellulales bacterium]|nr:hypothetical protein [Pirellulales bacterium]
MSVETPPQKELDNQPHPGEIAAESVIDDRLRKTQRQLRLVDVGMALLVLAIGVVGYLFLLVLADHWLVTGGLGKWSRFAAWLVLLVAGTGFFYVRILRPLVLRINPVYVAQTIEQSRPTLKNGLINFLLLRRQREAIPAVISREIEKQTAGQLADVSPEEVVDRRRVVVLSYVLVALLAVGAIYHVASPKNPLASVLRIAFPFSGARAPTRVQVDDIQPGNLAAPQGERVIVSAEARGLDDDEQLVIHYTTADRQAVDQVVPMSVPEGRYRHEAMLPPGNSGVQQDLTYYLAAGDFRSREFTITMETAPDIDVVEVDYEFPDYTGLARRTASNQLDLRAIEGTRVTLRAKASTPIDRAEIDLGCRGLRGVPMKADDRSAVGSFVLRPEHDCYQLRYVDAGGRANRRPIRHRIEVIVDRLPEVRLVDPPRDRAQLPVNGVLPLKVRAEDPDFALREVAIRAVHNERSLPIRPLLKIVAPSPPREGVFEETFAFKPAELGLKPGDSVEYWAEALDNKTPLAGRGETERRWITIVAPDPNQPQERQPSDQQEEEQGRGAEDQPSQDRQDQPDDQPQPDQRQPSDRQSADEQRPEDRQDQQDQQPPQPADQSQQADQEQPDQEQPDQEQSDQRDRQDQQESRQGQQQDQGQQGEEQPQDQQDQARPDQDQQDQGQQGQQDQGQQDQGQQDQGQQDQGQQGAAGQDQAAEQNQPGQSGQSGQQGQPGQQNQPDAQGRPGAPQGDSASPNQGAKSDGRSGQKPSDRPSEPIDGETNPGDVIQKALEQRDQDRQAPSGQNQPQKTDGQQQGRPGKESGQQAKPGEAQADHQQPDRGPSDRQKPSPGQQQGNRPEPSEPKPGAPESADRQPGDQRQPPGKSDQQESDQQASGQQESGQQESDQQGSDQQPPGVGQPRGPEDDRQATGAAGDQGRPGDDQQAGKPGRPGAAPQADQTQGDQPGRRLEPDEVDPNMTVTPEGYTDEAPNAKAMVPQGPAGGGGQPGETTPPEAQPDREDPFNRDYAAKQTILALEYLKDQLAKDRPDQKLLDSLGGWTREDLEKFTRRWEAMFRQAQKPGVEGQAAQARLDEALKSLGLHRGRTELKSGVQQDDIRRLRGPRRINAPPDWEEQIRAYRRSVGSEAVGRGP